MASFEVKIYPVKLEEHPNADAIELAVIGEYRSIVQKNTLKNGDLVAYIPEAAIVPDWLLEKMNLTGKLAGKQKNRVKALRLRGVLSQGLCYPLVNLSTYPTLMKKSLSGWAIQRENDIIQVTKHQDVTELLGITKYIPKIPTHMNGEVFNAFGCTIKYDIENWKKFPNVIQENEEVVFTEKLHGTFACYGYHPDITHPIVTSKGLSDKGLAFTLNESNKNNLYVKTFQDTINTNSDDIITHYRRLYPTIEPFYILGEIYGPGVQDLTYGTDSPNFRAFDVYIGEPGKGKYLDWEDYIEFCLHCGIDTVPFLYRGPFNKEIMMEHTDGKESVSGNRSCIREGLVIRLIKERRDLLLGRVLLKNVSDKYLTRKNGTEFN